MFVSIQPGPIEFTRMPAGASMRAAFFVSIQTAALDITYPNGPASGTLAAMDAIVTIDPGVPAASMRWPHACIAMIVPIRLTSITRRISSTSASMKSHPGRSTYSRPRR